MFFKIVNNSMRTVLLLSVFALFSCQVFAPPGDYDNLKTYASSSSGNSGGGGDGGGGGGVPGNMIQNGDFSMGTTYWASYGMNGGALSISALGGSLQILISSLGIDVSDLQVSQGTPGFPLVNGSSYTLTFDAWANDIRLLDVSVWENGHPTYGSYAYGSYSITPIRQTFTLSFVMSGNNSESGLCFFCGASTITIYIANVSLVKN